MRSPDPKILRQGMTASMVTRQIRLNGARMALLLILTLYLNTWLDHVWALLKSAVAIVWTQSVPSLVAMSPTLTILIGQSLLPVLLAARILCVFGLNFLLGIAFRRMPYYFMILVPLLYVGTVLNTYVFIPEVLSGAGGIPSFESLMPLVVMPTGLWLGKAYGDLRFASRIAGRDGVGMCGIGAVGKLGTTL